MSTTVKRVVVGPKTVWIYDEKLKQHRPAEIGETVEVSAPMARRCRDRLQDPEVAKAEKQRAEAEAKAEAEVAATPPKAPVAKPAAPEAKA